MDATTHPWTHAFTSTVDRIGANFALPGSHAAALLDWLDAQLGPDPFPDPIGLTQADLDADLLFGRDR